jgi:hypothetical protein
MGAMIIDEALPRYCTSLIRHTVVAASPEATYAAILRTDVFSDRLLRALFDLRTVPQRVVARVRGTEAFEAMPPSMTFAQVMDQPEGAHPLGQDPPHELLSGMIGKLWQKDFGWREFDGLEAFRDFDEPAYAKTVIDFSLRPYGDSRTLLSYESRTAGTDEEAVRKFRRYWVALRPGVAYVMRAALRLIKAEAERAAAVPGAAPPDAEPGIDEAGEVRDA